MNYWKEQFGSIANSPASRADGARFPCWEIQLKAVLAGWKRPVLSILEVYCLSEKTGVEGVMDGLKLHTC